MSGIYTPWDDLIESTWVDLGPCCFTEFGHGFPCLRVAIVRPHDLAEDVIRTLLDGHDRIVIHRCGELGMTQLQREVDRALEEASQ